MEERLGASAVPVLRLRDVHRVVALIRLADILEKLQREINKI